VAKLYLQRVGFSSCLVHKTWTLTLCKESKEADASRLHNSDIKHLTTCGEIPNRLRSWAKELWRPLKGDPTHLRSQVSVKTGNIPDSDCWENILASPAAVMQLEDLAVLLQSLNRYQKILCNSFGLKSEFVVVGTCPCCNHEKIARFPWVQLILIGTGTVRRNDIKLMLHGTGIPWHICFRSRYCFDPAHIIWADKSEIQHREKHLDLLLSGHGHIDSCVPPCFLGNSDGDERQHVDFTIRIGEAFKSTLRRLMECIMEVEKIERGSTRSDVEITTDDHEDSRVKSNAQGRNKVTKARQTSKQSSNQ
jgi:hypothetical protein